MALKGWDNSFSVNDNTMDADHQKLINNISILHEAMKMGKSKSVLEQLINDVNVYAQTHFSREEQYLTQIKHTELAAQKEQHKIFLDKVSEFKKNFANGQTVLAVEMLPFLNQWFLNHIMKIDMKYK